mmetsp:Transcript_115191/g.325489  ORF Transcript_115191/g.325489 Transcript_115191/m.325489 type:complete len:209 (-) Transcript_115191:33-659(-)
MFGEQPHHLRAFRLGHDPGHELRHLGLEARARKGVPLNRHRGCRLHLLPWCRGRRILAQSSGKFGLALAEPMSVRRALFLWQRDGFTLVRVVHALLPPRGGVHRLHECVENRADAHKEELGRIEGREGEGQQGDTQGARGDVRLVAFQDIVRGLASNLYGGRKRCTHSAARVEVWKRVFEEFRVSDVGDDDGSSVNLREEMEPKTIST